MYINKSNEASLVRHVGIVLYHKGRNIVVFDKNQQRVSAITYTKFLPRGSFISYNTIHFRSELLLQDIVLEYMPLAQAQIDIYFLHSLLEVCYYFIPEGGCEFFIYPIIIQVLRSFEQVDSKNKKKMLLCRIFAHLGIYPAQSDSYEALEDFLKMPIDNLIAGNLDLVHDDFFDIWLMWCLENHPQGKKCKALPLLL